MSLIVADQSTGIRAAVVGDRRYSVLSYNIQIKIDYPLASHIGRPCSHAVRRMACRAREPRIDVRPVLAPTAGASDDRQIMAFPADGIRPIDAQIGIGEKIRDGLAGCWRLTELVSPFQQVSPF